MDKKLIFILLILFVLLTTHIKAISADSKIMLDANTIIADEETDTIKASGDVVVKKDDMTLWADEVTYNKKTGIIKIPGKFSFYSNFVGYGEELTYDVNKKEGTLKKGDIFFLSQDPTKRRTFSGQNITLLDKESAFIEEGVFSSCEGDEKSWYIKGSNIRINAGQYLTAKHTLINFLGVPIFYSPYFIAPVKTEKESGFLIPTFGLSGEHGFLLTLPYYHVINESRDITSSIRLRTKNTAGLENQYRYMNDQNDFGEINLNLLDNYDKNKIYYLFNWKHYYMIDYNFKADLSFFNPKNYFKEYETESEKRNIPYLRSTAFIEEKKDRVILEGDILLSKKALIPVDVDNYQRLEIQRNVLLKGEKNILYNYDISLAGFSDKKNEQHLRAVFDGKSFLRFNENYGNAFIDGDIRYNIYTRSTEKGEFVKQGIFTFTPNLLFDRAYIINDNMLVLNTIKTDLILPFALSEDNIKVIDSKDVLDKSKQLVLNYEEKWYNFPSREQFMYLSINQGYQFTDRVDESPLSNLNLVFKYFRKTFAFNIESEYSHSIGNIAKALLVANYHSDFTKINLSYNYQRKNNEFLSVQLWQKLNSQWALTTQMRYDVKVGNVREVAIGGEVKQSCYSFSANFIRRTLPTEYVVLLSLNLYGLGEIKQSL